MSVSIHDHGLTRDDLLSLGQFQHDGLTIIISAREEGELLIQQFDDSAPADNPSDSLIVGADGTIRSECDHPLMDHVVLYRCQVAHTEKLIADAHLEKFMAQYGTGPIPQTVALNAVRSAARNGHEIGKALGIPHASTRIPLRSSGLTQSDLWSLPSRFPVEGVEVRIVIQDGLPRVAMEVNGKEIVVGQCQEGELTVELSDEALCQALLATCRKELAALRVVEDVETSYLAGLTLPPQVAIALHVAASTGYKKGMTAHEELEMPDAEELVNETDWPF